MNRRFWFCFIAIVFWIGNPGSLPAGPEDSGITLLLSADTRGELFKCRDCVADTQLGGLARRGTLVEGERAEHPGLLLVDAGNALFGPDTMASEGKVVLSAYAALDYDAVNLSYRDFRLGKAATVALVKQSAIPFVSANLLDQESGDPIAAPYRIKKTKERKIALIGLTQSPAGLSFLPHLQEQLAGIRIEPPAEALAKWLPRARHDADRVILLYYGSAAGMEPIRAQFADRLDAILVGGSRPEYLPSNTVPPIMGTTERGQHMAKLRLTGAGAKIQAEVAQVAVEPSLPLNPEIEKVLTDFNLEAPPTPIVTAREAGALDADVQTTKQIALTDIAVTDGSVSVSWQGIEKSTSKDWIGLYKDGAEDKNFLVWKYTDGTSKGRLGLPIPDSIGPGTYELRLFDNDGFSRLAVSATFDLRKEPLKKEKAVDSFALDLASNQAIKIKITDVQFARKVDGESAPTGKTYIVLDTHWENIHPKQKVPMDKGDITRGIGALGWGGGRDRSKIEYVEKDIAYKVERPFDHLYLLADGLAYALHKMTSELDGGMDTMQPLVLDEQGEVRELKLAFLIPEKSVHVAFRLFDYANGHATVSVRGDIESAGMEPPRLAHASLPQAAFIITSVDFQNTYKKLIAPSDWQYVVVGLGGKSLVGGGNIIEIDPVKSTWASTAEGYIYNCRESTTAHNGEIRFTPDVYQFQELAFLIPDDVKAIDLMLRLENKTAILHLSGVQSIPEPLAQHRDGDVLDVMLYDVHEDESLQILNLGLQSLTTSGIEIQPRQFQLLIGDREIELDSGATAKLLQRPPKPFVIPPGAFVRFELAYATTSLPTGLRYRGFKSERLIPIGKVPPIILTSAEVIRLSRGDPVGLSLEDTRRGVEINYVTPGSPAEQAGLQAGDRIVAVNGESGMNASDVMMAISAVRYANREKVLLKTRRGNDSFQVTLSAK